MINKIFILFGLLLLICVQNVFAFEHGGWHISQQSRFIGAADADNLNGTIALKNFSVSLKKESFAFEQIPVSTGFSFKRYFINNSTNCYLPDTLESKYLDLGAYFYLPYFDNQDLFLRINFIPVWYNTGRHDLDMDIVRYNSVYALGYRPNKDLILVGGLFYRPEDDYPLIPFMGFYYRMNQKISFNFLMPQPNIAYTLTPALDILVEFGFMYDEFDVVSGSYQGDVLRVSNYFLGMGIEQKITDSVRLKFSWGEVFAQEYEYLNQQTAVSVADSWYFSAKFSGKF